MEKREWVVVWELGSNLVGLVDRPTSRAIDQFRWGFESLATRFWVGLQHQIEIDSQGTIDANLMTRGSW
jgi:hypothetical protein